MNNTFYIQEAFSRLKLLDEDAFDFSKDAGIEDKLTSFVADDIDYEEEPIVDVEAETDSDLQDSYVGKVILECNCCHTRVYKDEDDVVIDEEEGSANMDEPCPVCNGEFGYTVIGKIEPFNANADPAEAEDDEPLEVDLTDEKDSEGEVEEEPAEEEEPEEDEDEDEDDDEKVESYRRLIRGKSLTEGKDKKESDDVCPECGKNPCVCEKCDEDLNEDAVDTLAGAPLVGDEAEAKLEQMYANIGWAMSFLLSIDEYDLDAIDEDKVRAIGSEFDSLGVVLQDLKSNVDSIDVEDAIATIDNFNALCADLRSEIGKAKRVGESYITESDEDVEGVINKGNRLLRMLKSMGIGESLKSSKGKMISESFANKLSTTLSMIDDFVDKVKSVDESINESGFFGSVYKAVKVQKIGKWIDEHKYVADMLSREDDDICAECLKKANNVMSSDNVSAKSLDEVYFYLNKIYKIMKRTMSESYKSGSGKRINEEELAHGNDQIGVRDDTSVDDDQSLEDDQTELYKAAFEKRDAINESHKKLANINRKIKSISEALDDVVVNTDDGSVEVSKEGQKVVVDFSGGGEGEMPESDPMAGEMIAPLGDEDIAGIEDNVPEDEMGGEEMPMDDMGTEGEPEGSEGEPMGDEEMPMGDEEMPMGDEEEEGPPMESLETNNDGKLFLEAFDNSGFEKMADVFMHRVYENVDSYKVNRVGQNDKNGSVIVEGVINFRSGKSAPTTFTFDSFSKSKTGKVVLEGINTTFSKTRAFRMRGSLTDKQYIPESFVYNFNTTALNESNESEVVKVQGRVKR